MENLETAFLGNFLLSDLRRILPVINLKMEIYLMILTYTHSKIFKDTLSAGAPIIRKPIFILNYQVFFWMITIFLCCNWKIPLTEYLSICWEGLMLLM